MPQRELDDFLHHHSSGSLMDVEVGGSTVPSMIRTVDRDRVTGRVIHLEIQRVNLDEMVHVNMPVAFLGEEELIRNGLVLERQVVEVDVRGRADSLPETLSFDVSHVAPGTTIRLRDLSLPEGLEINRDPETALAIVSTPTVSKDVEAALEAEEQARVELVESHTHKAEDTESEEEGEPVAA